MLKQHFMFNYQVITQAITPVNM